MTEPKTKQLKKHLDDRGWLMECMRPGWGIFERFGQAYVTTVFPGVVKAWHYHERQKDNFVCIRGNIKLVISPDGKEFKEYFLGEDNPMIVQIPENWWHGFMCLGNEMAIILNMPTNTFDYNEPDEIRKDWDGFEMYDWDDVNG